MIRTVTCQLAMAQANRPGVLARVSHIFAERGVNIEQLLACEQGHRQQIILRFMASPPVEQYLVRRLKRLRHVAALQVFYDMDQPVWELSDKLSGHDSSI